MIREKAKDDDDPRYCGSVWLVRKSSMPTLDDKSLAPSRPSGVRGIDDVLSPLLPSAGVD